VNEEVGFSQFVRSAEGGAAMDAELQKGFAQALMAAKALPEPLSATVTDADRRPQIEAALTAVKNLQNQLQNTVPHATDINTGFNSLDGD
jgi:predicted lipoprotein